MAQIRESVDVFLTHDWPNGIEKYGNLKKLLHVKPFFAEDIKRGKLGSKPSMDLLRHLRPRRWFSAHLHVKFEAEVIHERDTEEIELDVSDVKDGNSNEISLEMKDEEEKGTDLNDIKGDQINEEDQALLKRMEKSSEFHKTTFLALDRCLPRRSFLEIIDLPECETPEDGALRYDHEWLAITRACQPWLSLERTQPRLPTANDVQCKITEELKWVKQHVKDLCISNNFVKEVPTIDDPMWQKYHSAPNSKAYRSLLIPKRNPQTDTFCNLLQIHNVFGTLADEQVAALNVQGNKVEGVQN